MKYFVAVAATVALASSVEVALRGDDGGLQFIDFNDPAIQDLIAKLLALNKEIMCGSSVADLIASLNLPEQIMGILGLLKGILCIGA